MMMNMYDILIISNWFVFFGDDSDQFKRFAGAVIPNLERNIDQTFVKFISTHIFDEYINWIDFLDDCDILERVYFKSPPYVQGMDICISKFVDIWIHYYT